MSASKDNNIGLTEEPEEMFGKAMRIPDSLLGQWYALLMEREPRDGRPAAGQARARALPRRALARPRGGSEAEAHFTRVVREGQAPEDVPEVELPEGDPVHLPALLAAQLGIASTSEARRLIAQGGVKVNGEPVTELDVPRAALEGALVQAGKRRFARFRAR